MREHNNKPEILLPTSSGIFANGQCDCDCDCACEPVTVNRLVGPAQSKLWKRSETLSWQLSSDYDLILSVGGITGAVMLNQPAHRVFEAFSVPISLEDAPALISDLSAVDIIQTSEKLFSLGLIVPFPNFLSANCNSTPEILTAWLHLTDRCNLRCSYCYLPHVREDMSTKTGRAAVDAIFRSATVNGFKKVKIKYAGGEPLLQYPLILELHNYAIKLAKQTGVTLDEVVLSNGTLLTYEIAKTLKSYSIHLMISLDGIGRYHDSHRPYAGGRGSFTDVSEAVDLALVNRLIPDISITLSSRTAEGLPELITWILEREMPFSLNFYRENDFSTLYEDMQLDEEKIINGILAAFKVIENNLPRTNLLGGIIDRANLSFVHTHTCGVGQNYLVFNQNGQVAKCQMQIHKPITDIHVPDPLAVIRVDRNGIQNISVEEKEGCNICEWKHWCTGGCPLATYRATRRYDAKSPNCNIYKTLFPEALRLEGLRLLKYQHDPEVVTMF